MEHPPATKITTAMLDYIRGIINTTGFTQDINQVIFTQLHNQISFREFMNDTSKMKSQIRHVVSSLKNGKVRMELSTTPKQKRRTKEELKQQVRLGFQSQTSSVISKSHIETELIDVGSTKRPKLNEQQQQQVVQFNTEMGTAAKFALFQQDQYPLFSQMDAMVAANEQQLAQKGYSGQESYEGDYLSDENDVCRAQQKNVNEINAALHNTGQRNIIATEVLAKDNARLTEENTKLKSAVRWLSNKLEVAEAELKLYKNGGNKPPTPSKEVMLMINSIAKQRSNKFNAQTNISSLNGFSSVLSLSDVHPGQSISNVNVDQGKLSPGDVLQQSPRMAAQGSPTSLAHTDKDINV